MTLWLLLTPHCHGLLSAGNVPLDELVAELECLALSDIEIFFTKFDFMFISIEMFVSLGGSLTCNSGHCVMFTLRDEDPLQEGLLPLLSGLWLASVCDLQAAHTTWTVSSTVNQPSLQRESVRGCSGHSLVLKCRDGKLYQEGASSRHLNTD